MRFSDGRHARKHQNGGADEISLSGLRGQQIVVPKNDKIADINQPDTLYHFLDLEAALAETRKIIQLELFASRVSGSGGFYAYPNEGTVVAVINGTIIIKDGTQRVKYRQTVANDDWDIFCGGYVVEA